MAKEQPAPAVEVRSSPAPSQVALKATPAQVEQLARLGVLTPAQLEAGRKAGGLEILLPAELVRQFQAHPPPLPTEQEAVTQAESATPTQAESESQAERETEAEIERLALRLHRAGFAGAARLMLGAGRPLSFFGSQLLLLAQPVSRLAFGPTDPAGRWATLLEERANVDRLLARLDVLERAARPPSKSNRKRAKTRKEPPR